MSSLFVGMRQLHLVADLSYFLDVRQLHLVADLTYFRDVRQLHLVADLSHFRDVRQLHLVADLSYFRDVRQLYLVADLSYFRDVRQLHLVADLSYFRDVIFLITYTLFSSDRRGGVRRSNAVQRCSNYKNLCRTSTWTIGRLDAKNMDEFEQFCTISGLCVVNTL